MKKNIILFLAGLAIMQVLAICKLKQLADFSDLPYNVTVLCVSEEEGSSKKSASLSLQNISTDFLPQWCLAKEALE